MSTILKALRQLEGDRANAGAEPRADPTMDDLVAPIPRRRRGGRRLWLGVGLAVAGVSLLAVALILVSAGASRAVELTMYYPVAVGGSLTKIVDGLVADFMKANPDIKVKAIYAGNYNDARIKALAALKAGKPAQLSVMFAIDIYELIEQDAIIPFDDIVDVGEVARVIAVAEHVDRLAGDDFSGEHIYRHVRAAPGAVHGEKAQDCYGQAIKMRIRVRHQLARLFRSRVETEGMVDIMMDAERHRRVGAID